MSEKARGYAHRVDVGSNVRQVWDALADPANLSRWCSPKAQIRAHSGGLFRASVDRMTELEAHIDVFDPPRRMRLIYMATPSLPATDSVIVDDFILEPLRGAESGTGGGELDPRTAHRLDGSGTIVRLLGSGYPTSTDWDVPYMRLRTGWQQALSRLKVFVERQLDRSGS